MYAPSFVSRASSFLIVGDIAGALTTKTFPDFSAQGKGSSTSSTVQLASKTDHMLFIYLFYIYNTFHCKMYFGSMGWEGKENKTKQNKMERWQVERDGVEFEFRWVRMFRTTLNLHEKLGDRWSFAEWEGGNVMISYTYFSGRVSSTIWFSYLVTQLNGGWGGVGFWLPIFALNSPGYGAAHNHPMHAMRSLLQVLGSCQERSTILEQLQVTTMPPESHPPPSPRYDNIFSCLAPSTGTPT